MRREEGITAVSFYTKSLETIFWFIAIASTIFLNLSSQAFQDSKRSFYISLLLAAALIIIIIKGFRLIKTNSGKVMFAFAFTVAILLPILLINTPFEKIVTFYYLPTVIPIFLTTLLMVEVKVHYILIVGLCIFFLGNSFLGINVTKAGSLAYPLAFIRVFSLTLLIIFSYYIYTKEKIVRRKLDALTERLRRLDKIRAEFVTNVSHELRTPLTSMRNAAVLLKTKLDNKQIPVPATEQELLDIIIANSDRQSRLIDTLLDLAKIETGKVTMGRSLIDLGKIAEEVIKSLSIMAAKKKIEFIKEFPQETPKIWASADQIAEVYTNLIDNAIKYNKEGGKIYVRIKVIENGVESTVEDTGIGIAPENVGKLFEKFKRLADEKDKTKAKGTGLGLVISKEIIEMHGGKISVESIYGEATKFRFVLPAGLRGKDRDLLKHEK